MAAGRARTFQDWQEGTRCQNDMSEGIVTTLLIQAACRLAQRAPAIPLTKTMWNGKVMGRKRATTLEVKEKASAQRA